MGWIRCADIVGGYQKRYFGTLVPNVYISNSDGQEISYNNWSATGYLEVVGGTETVLCQVFSGDNYNAFYDENKTFISNFYYNGRPITIPQNAKYMRVSAHSTNISATSYYYYYVNTPKFPTKTISSTGDQQITLPIKASEPLTFKFGIFFLSGDGTRDSDRFFMGDAWDNRAWLLHTHGNFQIGFRYTSSTFEFFDLSPFVLHEIEVNTTDATLIIDGVTKTGGHTVSYQLDEYIKIFGENCYACLTTIKIYKNGSLYMNLEPRQDSSTGDGYYYDTINNQSYYSETSTPLIYGEI